jgi:hypothetical protein
MARFLADEDFRAAIAERLRELGHDVTTAVQAGVANSKLADGELLLHASRDGRSLLTHNRLDFHRLHREVTGHAGIITCRQDGDAEVLAGQIHAAVEPLTAIDSLVIRVYLNGRARIEPGPPDTAPGES